MGHPDLDVISESTFQDAKELVDPLDDLIFNFLLLVKIRNLL